ncbi:MAG TPA: ATP-binding protein [Xanthobacteraceae bacterium]|nr:ATP-binding protein [Xanthobacteraceae bacterium]
MRIETIKREARGIALAVLLVAVTTVIADSLVQYLGIRRGSVIYLLAVLVSGWRFGLWPAIVAAVTGVLGSGVLFYTPNTQRSELLDLALFLIVALVASHVANSMKQQTDLARKREKEMTDLYAFSRRLAAAPSAAEIYRAIEDHLTTHAQRKVVLFGAASPNSDGEQPGDAAVPPPVRAAIADVQRGHSIEANVTDETGNVWHVRRVSQKTPDFGVIAIDLGRVPADEAADVHQRVNDMLSDAADTLERLDVAHALDQAKMRSETELLREALIGSVSHELRTPLASILGAATVLSQSPAVANDERLNSLASVVRDEAERLNNDIQNLLDATRITREQIKPRMEWIEPSDIVNSALERRRRRLLGHTVSLDVDSNLPFIYVDPVLIEQAFAQVVDNAAKYSPAGSTITVAAKRNGHGLVLSVRDTGVGLTEEESAQLGDRFFRGARHAATTSGSGLGLWIAKAFVSANGGRLEADSAGPNLGTMIAIKLPVAPNAPQQETDPDD